ncbi:MAG: hypothetical protein DRR08_08425 [Candidatus Parabeggiatoa sp. nov. 2]|nr:MAG: hypothetical protein B6247_16895 [Beggiatoa sp. 4572_84]RKZ61573.1 MAG: hypothetical protein DRR08_08425 [Gammaproteobacteria bacterium]HEC85131.1 hypothetical protein [Thioploca sp.]
MPVIYTFEAKSIQSYILDSSQLRDMVGASEQIENLTRRLLDKVLQALNLEKGKDIQFSRRAGGAFIAILNTLSEAKKLRDLWTFTVRYCLPGLEFVQGLTEDTDILVALKAANQQKSTDQNRLFPVFPIAGPLVARGPRTGEPAVTEKPNPNNGGTERLDKRTALRREYLHQAQLGTGLVIENKLELTTASATRLVWPQNLNEDENQPDEQHFPTLGNNHYIAVIHADGNGLGELLIDVREDITNVPQHYVDVFSALSDTLEKATIAATRQAAQKVLVPKAQLRHDAQGKALQVMPARPLILNGDNLTIIVRGDLAIPFTQQFLDAFERHSEESLTKLNKFFGKIQLKLRLPKSLTACAGIAFVKSSQPFDLAYGLADSLCQTAKKQSKQSRSADGRVPSSLAFHRITTNMIDDYDTICQRELCTQAGWMLSMQPYAVGSVNTAPDTKAKRLPSLQDLEALRRLLADEKISLGATRELLNLLHLSPMQAQRTFRRWRENMLKMPWDKYREFESLLKKMVVESDKELPILSAKDKRTPLADAIAWNSVARGGEV